MKLMNCASLIALVAGGLSLTAPASATPVELAISPASISVSHDVLKSTDLLGDESFLAQSQQQQQQQQQRHLGLESLGVVYGAPADGFSV